MTSDNSDSQKGKYDELMKAWQRFAQLSVEFLNEGRAQANGTVEPKLKAELESAIEFYEADVIDKAAQLRGALSLWGAYLNDVMQERESVEPETEWVILLHADVGYIDLSGMGATKDIQQALRFKRKQDAEQYAGSTGGTVVAPN